MARELPSRPDLEWLKKTAKEWLAKLRVADPGARLFQAQLEIARDYGFQSWRALVAHVQENGADGQLIRAAREGRAAELARLLDEYPSKLSIIGGAYNRPLLHHAAEGGHRDCVAALLKRGFPVNTRDRLDHATALHWAAQAGQTAVVKQLLDAGADIDGEGDAHEANVIGWATVLQGVQREVAELLLKRGAQPTIFAAVALGREDLVRKLAEEDPAIADRRMSHHERNQTPLHFAVSRNQPPMVNLLIELGADVAAKDSSGATPMKYAQSNTSQVIVDALVEAGADPAERSNYFEGATPQLDVKSVPAAVAYFTEKLGFEKEWEAGSPSSFACVFRDQVYVFLTSQRTNKGAALLPIRVRDLDGLHTEYKTRGTTIVKPPANTQWGGRTLEVTDPDGNVLSFWTQVSTADGLR